MNRDTKQQISGEPGKTSVQKKKDAAGPDINKELQKLLKSHRTIIKVFGAGGAGNNTISRLMQIGLENVETYAVNTDAQDLLFTQSNQKVLIGRNITNGLGAGSDPQIGEDSARENQDELKELVSKTDLVFITCGLGGGTGSGSAPVIAELARESNALTISIVTLPFSEEGVLRWNNAHIGLEKLRKHSDTLIVIQNDKLWEIAPEIPLDDAFKVADEILVNAVKGITELVTKKGLVNLDFADIRSIMKDGGTALIGMAESDSPDRSAEAVEKAIENPLIDLDINGAKSALLNISGGEDMTIKDAKIAMQTLSRKLDKSARIIWGSKIDPELENKIRVMIIATGLQDHATDKLFRVERPELESLITPVKAEEKAENDPVVEIASEESEEKVLVEENEKKENSKGEAKKIFREIMQDETDADLKIFQDSINALYKKADNSEKWQELQKSCSALYGTAQMFDFYEIAELMASLEEMLTGIIGKKLFVKNLVDILEILPAKILLMISDDSGVNEWAKVFKENVIEISNYFKKHKVVSKDSFLEKLGKIWQEKIVGSEVEKEVETKKGKKEQTKEEKISDSAKVTSDANKSKKKEKAGEKEKSSDKSRFSSVNDVVKYVDNLLRGEPKSSKLED